MQPTPPPVAELLTSHAASLRTLARQLVGDVHAAEDALQDTWVRALERPPPRVDALGGWLRAVLRSVVANRRRGAARREAREALAARPEAQGAGSEARVRTLRAVVDAVLALDEPYRRTVLARWFEDLPPREIARREKVSIHTVESRLQRGLARLRERLARELEDEAGGARRALLLLAGLRPEGAGALVGAATATGALVVGTKATVGLGGAAAALAAWLAWMAWPEPAAPVEAAAPGGELAALRSPLAPLAEPPIVEQAAVEAPVVTRQALPLAPGKTVDLEVLVTDAEGVPQGGATLALAPARHTLNVVARTGNDGRAEVHLPITGPSVELVVVAWHSDRGVAGPWRFEAVPRGVVRVTLALGPLPEPPLELERSPGEEPEEALSRATESLTRRRLGMLTEAPRFPPRRTAPGARRAGEEVQLVDPGDPARGFDRPSLQVVIDRLRLERLGYGSSSAQASPARADTVRVVGSVVDRDRRSVAGVLVSAGPPGDPHGHRARTDDLGGFVMPDLPAGELSLSAFSLRHGRASEQVLVVSGVRVWEPALDPGETWSGRLEPRRGDLPAISRVEWVSADKQHLDVRVAALSECGRVELTSLPRDWGALLASSWSTSIPWVVDAKEAPRARERALRVDAHDARTGELRLRVRAPRHGDGEADPAVEVRVWTRWKAPADRGTWMRPGHGSGEYLLAGLPRGRYTVEVGSPASGWVDVGTLDLGPEETLDLGTIDLPAPARVRRTGDATGRRWLLRRDAVETLVAVLDGPGSVPIACPAGTYLIVDPDDRSRGFALALAAGETVVVSDAGVLSREPPR